MPYWQTVVRRDQGVFREISAWWDSQPAPQQNPFLTSDVLSCWENGFEEPESQCHVLLLYRQGELVAGLPLYRVGRRLRSLVRTHAEPFDVVLADDDEVLDYLPHWIGSLPVAHLYRIPETSPIIAHLPNQRRWHIQSTFNSTFIDLAKGMNEVRAGMSTKYQRELRRRRRRLQEMGDLVFVEHSKREGAQDLLTKGLALEAAGWKGRRGIAALQSPSIEQWYRSVTDVAADRGWLRLCLLYLDDRLVSFLYNLEVAGRRIGMATAFDESSDVAPFSPGTLLHESVFEASASRVSMYRFGVGEDNWKREWATDSDRVFDLVMFGSGGFARGAHSVWKMKSSLRSRAQDRSSSGKRS